MYVQELAEKEGSEIHDLLVNRGAHFYVCGDCKMAEDVHQKLKGIIKKHGNMADEQVQNFMYMLKVCNLYIILWLVLKDIISFLVLINFSVASVSSLDVLNLLDLHQDR